MVVLGGRAVSYERGTPVTERLKTDLRARFCGPPSENAAAPCMQPALYTCNTMCSNFHQKYRQLTSFLRAIYSSGTNSSTLTRRQGAPTCPSILEYSRASSSIGKRLSGPLPHVNAVGLISIPLEPFFQRQARPEPSPHRPRARVVKSGWSNQGRDLMAAAASERTGKF
jgi:hypothetical protein